MKNFRWKKILPHVIAILVFLVVALIYCKPALEGKVLEQGDVTQVKGMAQNSVQYAEKHNALPPLWTNGMFCGMPAYQITMGANNPISISYIQNFLTLDYAFKPFYFFFLACICFYFLSQILKINPYLGMISALAYAYATYNPIIVAAGHDTKMLAIAYLPAFIGSLLLVYEKKYLLGAALTALFTALLVGANHVQISYYTFIIAFFMSIGYLVKWIKEKDFKHIFISVVIVFVCGIIGVMVTAVNIFTTYEYSKLSIRGGSVLADEKSDYNKTGLSNDYALSYSVYKTEPLVMMFPHLYGGSSGNLEVSEDKSKAIAALQEMPQQLAQQIQGSLQFYWGGIDGVGTAGPPYAGAIICFLALLGFAVLDNKHKWWILAACIVTLLMSWGKYFEGFNVFLLNHLPMYNKFRAPSMILVVPTFLLGMLAMLTTQKIIDTKDKSTLLKPLKKGLIITAGVFVFALLVYLASDFTSQTDKTVLQQVNSIPDAQQKQAILEPVTHFFNALKEDRQGLALSTIFRSFIFIALVIIGLWFYIKNKINTTVLLVAVGFLSFIDIILIDNKYLNEDHYQDADDYSNNFKPSAVDNEILKDTSFYRVFNVSHGISGAFNADAMTSYFHKSIGGYHPAKLSIYQDLIEHQLYKFPNCMPVINMLNTKYVILSNPQNGQLTYQINPENLGAVWFVKDVLYKSTPGDMMKALDNFNPRDTAFVYDRDKSLVNYSNQTDTNATIRLLNNDNDVVNYKSYSNANRFAVFSEIFYNKGWKAYIDEKETPIVQTNYVLRGLSIPAGEHEIKFEFKPTSYYLGNKLSIISSAIIWLLLIAAIVQYFMKQKKLSKE